MLFSVMRLHSAILQGAMGPLDAANLAMFIRNAGLQFNATFRMIFETLLDGIIFQQLVVRSNELHLATK